MTRITIDPITRLEGHGKIEIFLDEAGNVANAYFQIPELRGFEQFCVGRPAEEMPRITNRICGVCPEAHHMAATKALDMLYGVEPSSAVKKLREMFYCAFYVTDHTVHFYALGGPDFVIGPDAPAGERNILGVIHKVGVEIGKQVIACRQRNHHVIKMVGGRGVHPWPACPVAGAKPSPKPNGKRLRPLPGRTSISVSSASSSSTRSCWAARLCRHGAVDTYTHRTYYMGTVDEQNKSNFYDGLIRVVDPDGKEFVKYPARDYAQHIAERVEPWSYLKFPYLKGVGWKGFVDGNDSGVYCATPCHG